MPSSEEYRHRANACLELSKEAGDVVFARTALMELAQEFHRAADEAERRSFSKRRQRRRSAPTGRPQSFLRHGVTLRAARTGKSNLPRARFRALAFLFLSGCRLVENHHVPLPTA